MKNVSLFISAVALIMLSSCEVELPYAAGFDSALGKDSNGLVIVHVNPKAKSLVLEGSVTLFEGEVEVTLIDPDDCVAYKTILHPSNTLPILKSFVIVPGFWTLKYKSLEGVGSIDLSLCYH